MRIYLIILLFGITFFSCDKEKPDPTDNEPTFYLFPGYIGNSNQSAVKSNDDNILICGYQGIDVILLKVSKNGDEIWRSSFDPGKNSTATALVQTNNNEIFICGNTDRNEQESDIDILLVKTDAQGDTLWTKTYGGPENDYVSNIIYTSDGNILISGKTESFGAGSWGDFYLVKVNPNGDTLWTKSYSDPDQEVPFHLLETMAGDYIITGTNEDYEPREIYLVKVGLNGEKLWDRKIGPPIWKWGSSTIALSNLELMICGKVSIGDGYSQVLVVKTDSQGNTIWEKEYGIENLNEQGMCLKQNIDETFTISGSGTNSETRYKNMVLLKIDQEGNELWSQNFGSEGADLAWNLLKDSNDDNLVVGELNSAISLTVVDTEGNFK